MLFSALGTVLIFAGVEPIVSLMSRGFSPEKQEQAPRVVAQSDEDFLREQIELAMKRRAEEAQVVTLRYEQIEALKTRRRPEIVAAALECNTREVQTLLQSGANVNERDSRGETALAAAVKRGCLPVAESLIRAGADPGIRAENGYSAIEWAKFFGREREQKLLLARAQ